MQYVVYVLLAVVVLYILMQLGGSSRSGRRPRRIDHDRINDMFNKAEGALAQGNLQYAEGLFSQALNYARGGDAPVHIATSYYGLARVQEERKFFREAVHLVDLAIRAIEPHKADLENYYSLLTRYKGELSARIKG